MRQILNMANLNQCFNKDRRSALESHEFSNVLHGSGMQWSGILQPFQSSPCGHDICPSPQLLGQGLLHIPKPDLDEGTENSYTGGPRYPRSFYLRIHLFTFQKLV